MNLSCMDINLRPKIKITIITRHHLTKSIIMKSRELSSSVFKYIIDSWLKIEGIPQR